MSKQLDLFVWNYDNISLMQFSFQVIISSAGDVTSREMFRSRDEAVTQILPDTLVTRVTSYVTLS